MKGVIATAVSKGDNMPKRKRQFQQLTSFRTSLERLEPRLLLAADVGAIDVQDSAVAHQPHDIGDAVPEQAAQINVPELQILPGDTAIGPAEGHQMEADISQGGNQSLVVWSDYRSSPDNVPPFATEGSGADIYGRILDANGNPISQTSFVINQDFGDQDLPDVSWNGENWLVVWKTETATLPTYEKLMAARVAADGTVLDETPIEVHNNESYYENFEPYKIASDGQDWVIVFQANGPTSGVLATRVAADGTILGPTPTVMHSTDFSTDFDITFATDEYLFTWSDDFNGPPRGRLFTPDLQPIVSFVLAGADNVATDGTDFLVTYTADGPGAWFTLKGVIVRHDGTRPNPQGFEIVSQSSVCCTELVWDGAHYWATWGGLSAARITPDGTVVDPGGFTVGGFGQFSVPHDLDAAPSGGIQLVWNDGEDRALDPKDVYTTNVSASTQVGGDILVSSGTPSQLNSDFAEGPDMFAVAFESRLSGVTSIKAQRLDAGGTALDAEPIEIAAGPNVSGPGVAYDGTRYMITWRDGFSIFAQRMATDGTLLDEPTEVMATWDDPDVAGIDGTFLVVGTDYLSNDDNSRVAFTRRVDGATGALLDPAPQELGNFVIFSRNPHVVTFGSRWLVTWQTNISHDNTIAGTKAAFVDLDGTSPGPFSVGLGWDPDVAVSADRALFVAVSDTVASANNDIDGRIMLADGTFPNTFFTISAAPEKQLAPAVTFDGEDFLVVWEDKRDTVIHFDERTDIYGTRVTVNGEVLDFDGNGDGGIPMTSTPQPENDPALITSGGTTLFGVSTFVSQPEYGAFRLGVARTGSVIPGDFNGDQVVNADDIDMLCAEMNGGGNASQFDLTGDGLVDIQDMDELVLNILGTLYGDANLDLRVDGQDFLAWNANKFQTGGWAAGDFNCDGIVDGQDFLVWNANKFQTGSGGTGLRAKPLQGLAFVHPQLSGRASETADAGRRELISTVLAVEETRAATDEPKLAAWQDTSRDEHGNAVGAAAEARQTDRENLLTTTTLDEPQTG